jgi:hypothetical protein
MSFDVVQYEILTASCNERMSEKIVKKINEWGGGKE